MKVLKGPAALTLAITLVALFASGVLAASPPSKGFKVVFGTLCSYQANHAATIASPSSSCAGTTTSLKLSKHTKLVDETKPISLPAVGDSVAAFLEWHHGHYVVKKLEYGTSPFVFRSHLFAGRFASFTGTCAAGTLMIKVLGKHGATVSFSTDSSTVYKQANSSGTCASVTGSYKAKERINVTGGELTNATWYAEIVNANPM